MRDSPVSMGDVERQRGIGPGTEAPAAGGVVCQAVRPPARPAAGLPALPSPLIGRDAELAAIRRQLQRAEVRLLTLTGPPGVGKTSLAIAAAGGLTGAVEGRIAYADVAPVDGPEDFLRAIGAAVGVRPAGRLPALADLLEAMGEQPCLLVLDGCERATAWTRLIGDLLAGCPRLRILAAGRAALRSGREHELPVLPLAVPDPTGGADPADLAGIPSVDLFLERLRAARPEFALTRENAGVIQAICARLDGLPLAIELAAARGRVLSPGAILARLDRPLALLSHHAPDRPWRHQSLRAAIAWSDDLLGPAERQFFYRLAVCAGDFSFGLAEAVANPHEDLGVTTFDLVTALVDQNLLQIHLAFTGGPTFRLLETIRAYAWERRAADPAELETTLRRWAARQELDPAGVP